MDREDLDVLLSNVSMLKAEGKFKEVIEGCQHLLENGLRLKEYKFVLAAHAHSAAAYYSIGDLTEAFNSIEAHEELCTKHGNETDKLYSYTTLFLLHTYNKEYSNAKATLKKSIDLGEKLKHYNMVSNGYNNYSHVCLAEENFDEALAMGEIAIAMAKLHQPTSPILELRIALNVASAYVGLKNFDASKLLIDEILNHPILDSFIREKAQCYYLMGQWFSAQQRFREAFDAYTTAKYLAASYNDLDLLKDIQEQRCELCEHMDDKLLGYEVQKEYISVLNEISKSGLALAALKLEIKHSISTIEKRANTDYLTGLYNRCYLESTTNEWLEKAAQDNESIVCIAFDIDNFKLINDEYGHLVGDAVMKKISQYSSAIFRETDLMSRFGGDEFVVILKDISLKGGKMKAEQLLETIRSIVVEHEGQYVSITASVGVTDNVKGTVLYFNELFNAADTALYQAKENGKNQVYVVN